MRPLMSTNVHSSSRCHSRQWPYATTTHSQPSSALVDANFEAQLDFPAACAETALFLRKATSVIAGVSVCKQSCTKGDSIPEFSAANVTSRLHPQHLPFADARCCTLLDTMAARRLECEFKLTCHKYQPDPASLSLLIQSGHLIAYPADSRNDVGDSEVPRLPRRAHRLGHGHRNSS